MAPTKGKAAAPAAEDLAVSMDQDTFQAGGLATDFDGEVVEAAAVIWDYDSGKGPKIDDAGNPVHTLAVRATIRRDDGEPDVVNYWSAGDATQFAPGVDRKTLAPIVEEVKTGENAEGQEVEVTTQTAEGICFLRTGKRESLNNNTNWAQMLEALKDAEAQAPHLRRERTPEVTFLVGLYGHWDRIPQRKRSGMVKSEDEGKRGGFAREILACTQVKQKAAGAVATKVVGQAPKPPAPKLVASKSAATQAAPAMAGSSAASSTGAGNDLDTKLAAIVVEAVNAAGDAGLLKGKLAGVVLKHASLAATERPKAVPRVTSNEFLDSLMTQELVVFDAESGQLNAWPTE